MSLNLRWVGEADYDRVAEARMLCYGQSPLETPKFADYLRIDPRARPGDFLLAEDGSDLTGTATVYDFNMWVRGSPLPCQGVAFVGTARTRRRGKPGVASRVMHECLAEARRRGQVLSALMPFRASYYEHFGYGVVERRCEWTVPLAVLPHGDSSSIRYARPADRPAIAACHLRSVQRGQCDIERNTARWDHIVATSTEGFEVVDADADRVRGFIFYNQFAKDGKDYLRVLRHASDDLEALRRQLYFFATLKDQYYAVTITLPADVPFNWLLKERQLPHRPVNHQYAEFRTITRMQVRVLDHAKLLGAMKLPTDARGEAVVAVRETEGHVSKFRLAIDGGRAAVTATDSSADVECSDVTWAAVALGEMSAATAARLGLIEVSKPDALRTLGALSVGPVPFCEEYF